MELKDYQKKLIPYAYNILGSYDDAKDAVQDVFVKYYLSDKSGIENENNYLIRGVINQSINLKKKKSRTSGFKLSLPEPMSTDQADSGIVKKDILSYSLLVLLDSLNPKERAVFILKEAFDYSHEEIAAILDLSVENSRKLLSRAKTRLSELKQNRESRPFTNPQQLENYIQAIQNDNLKELEKMLATDIRVMTDGGNVKIVAEMVKGIEPVVQLMTYVYKAYQKNTHIKIASVNHQPALLFYFEGLLTNCQVFDLDPETGIIRGIFSIVDPEKLKNFNAT